MAENTKGCVGHVQKMVETLDKCISANKSMPMDEMKGMMDTAQACHEAMTGSAHSMPEPKPKKDVEPPARKAGVAYLDTAAK